MNPSKEKGIKSRVEAFYKNDYFPTISKECENALRRFPKQQNGDVLKKLSNNMQQMHKFLKEINDNVNEKSLDLRKSLVSEFLDEEEQEFALSYLKVFLIKILKT